MVGNLCFAIDTHREADLLIDEQRSSEVAKQRVAEVTGHELAHFWFGNLVTHDFWNLVWLKVQIILNVDWTLNIKFWNLFVP